MVIPQAQTPIAHWDGFEEPISVEQAPVARLEGRFSAAINKLLILQIKA
jgi:hypothetical protein